MRTIFKFLGIAQTPVSHAEKIVSALGGFVGIFCIFIISEWAVGSNAAAVLVASMGASAVLLFAVPHGPLSQPWSVFGGHIVSAIVGVSCAKFIPDVILAASVAVGAAIGLMYYLRCIHPPGGATAISAVIGGDAVHDLGYLYVITPVLLNVLLILLVAIVFNYAFSWRRYPAYLHKLSTPASSQPQASVPHIAHEDFVYALSEIDSFIDIDERDLLRIYDLATQKAKKTPPPPAGPIA
jgi:CBS domain-containing membrane protein